MDHRGQSRSEGGGSGLRRGGQLQALRRGGAQPGEKRRDRLDHRQGGWAVPFRSQGGKHSAIVAGGFFQIGAERLPPDGGLEQGSRSGSGVDQRRADLGWQSYEFHSTFI